MTTYDIIYNLFLGLLALSFFVAVAKLLKAKQNYRLAIGYALMGLSILIVISLDIIQANALSDASEKQLGLIQSLETLTTGYFLGLVTCLFIFVKFKRTKEPQQSG